MDYSQIWGNIFWCRGNEVEGKTAKVVSVLILVSSKPSNIRTIHILAEAATKDAGVAEDSCR